jgi:hypothetical protein
MTIKEILDSEDKNKGYIYLRLEGIFWKAYEQSAYLFIREMKPFKVVKHFVKAVEQNIVSLGLYLFCLDFSRLIFSLIGVIVAFNS